MHLNLYHKHMWHTQFLFWNLQSFTNETRPKKSVKHITTYAPAKPDTYTHTSAQSLCVNHRVYQCLSSGRGVKMTNKTSGTLTAAVTGAWQEMLESLTPSEGWGASGLIRTSCHLWRPPWQTWEWVWESERSGTSWQSDPGPVAAALAMQWQSVWAWETSHGHRNCLPGSALTGRRDGPRTPMWTIEGARASSTGWDWPWNLQ